jgi:hypothetical protein
MSGLGAAPRGLAHPQLWPRAHSVGLIDAPKMGKRLAKRDVQPDLILSSPARRMTCSSSFTSSATSWSA